MAEGQSAKGYKCLNDMIVLRLGVNGPVVDLSRYCRLLGTKTQGFSRVQALFSIVKGTSFQKYG